MKVFFFVHSMGNIEAYPNTFGDFKHLRKEAGGSLLALIRYVSSFEKSPQYKVLQYHFKFLTYEHINSRERNAKHLEWKIHGVVFPV